MHDYPELVIVGPAAAGKSTLGKLVAERLSTRFIDLDEVAKGYYDEVGWNLALLAERIAAVGRRRAEREWEVARAHAVERVVHEGQGAVIALGAGHTSFTHKHYFAKVKAALSNAGEVVLVLPTEDRGDALRTLRSRSIETKGTDWISAGHDFLAQWLDDAGTREVSTAVIYTGRETPAQTAHRIVTWLERGASTAIMQTATR